MKSEGLQRGKQKRFLPVLGNIYRKKSSFAGSGDPDLRPEFVDALRVLFDILDTKRKGRVSYETVSCLNFTWCLKFCIYFNISWLFRYGIKLREMLWQLPYISLVCNENTAIPFTSFPLFQAIFGSCWSGCKKRLQSRGPRFRAINFLQTAICGLLHYESVFPSRPNEFLLLENFLFWNWRIRSAQTNGCSWLQGISSLLKTPNSLLNFLPFEERYRISESHYKYAFSKILKLSNYF